MGRTPGVSFDIATVELMRAVVEGASAKLPKHLQRRRDTSVRSGCLRQVARDNTMRSVPTDLELWLDQAGGLREAAATMRDDQIRDRMCRIAEGYEALIRGDRHGRTRSRRSRAFRN
jgi:hypothetical protein